MRREEQTSKHLLLAVIVTIFSSILNLVTVALGWELWIIPLAAAGCFCVWFLHIGRVGSDTLYETLCAGLLLVEFFFFSVHETSLFDIPAMAGILVFSLFMLNKKWILHVTVALYAVALLYHIFVLQTVSSAMKPQDMLRLGLGAVVIIGGTALARYWINRRTAQRKWYENIFAELRTLKKQNAVFLSNVSHELRTPINMVIGLSEVALGKDPAPEIRSDISSIKLAGTRLSSQISNMMDYTEIVAGTLTPAKEEYMITSVLNDVITSTALQSNRQHLELVFDINPKVPAVLVGDAEKISHVLKILVENSIKFTEEGGVNVRIGYRQEGYGINLVIDIHDTGIGMTNAQLTKMYDDFYQADSGSNRFAGGLGLGLPIARGLLNAMGGFIHFASKTQQGLHAHIVIPQGVVDWRPCITLAHADQLCIGCFFKPDKYTSDEVRGYYDGLILSLMQGLGIKGYQAHNFEGLLRLQHSHVLTHVFIAQPEYEENRAYYEELAQQKRVIVIAEREFTLDSKSGLLVIHKPFSALSVANLLNGEVGERGFAEDQAAGRKPFTCVGVRALAVDDEEMNLVVAKGVLGTYGIEVDTCLSGRGAIEQCEDHSYDIIFLDHMMPGFDGVETLKRIRELRDGMYQDLPVIALTANTVSGAREMFRSEGFTEFVPKPIDRTVLERVLRKVLPKSCIQYSQTHGKKAVVADETTLSAPLAAEEKLLPPEKAEGPGPEHQPDAATAKGQPASPFEQLAQAGVNVQMGLDYCAGDEDFYREMLRMFRDQGQEKQAEIVSLYESENWADYAVKVHALKSTALTIGAENLSAQAKELELAGKRADEGFIRAHHAALLQAHTDMCGQIAGI
ncbi:hybrid sensor histidine kinase/response regulator [Acutalibacter caecimuris]|uniref:hybrid sensor histidine kinase/response regulator n=1 Tax=Acutalibacter caecimuris TaxID=3093657 RepID=UPI002AC8F55D|nr:response regulator [Acutalibacter sp. M00118]